MPLCAIQGISESAQNQEICVNSYQCQVAAATKMKCYHYLNPKMFLNSYFMSQLIKLPFIVKRIAFSLLPIVLPLRHHCSFYGFFITPLLTHLVYPLPFCFCINFVILAVFSTFPQKSIRSLQP